MQLQVPIATRQFATSLLAYSFFHVDIRVLRLPCRNSGVNNPMSTFQPNHSHSRGCQHTCQYSVANLHVQPLTCQPSHQPYLLPADAVASLSAPRWPIVTNVHVPILTPPHAKITPNSPSPYICNSARHCICPPRSCLVDTRFGNSRNRIRKVVPKSPYPNIRLQRRLATLHLVLSAPSRDSKEYLIQRIRCRPQ